MELTALVATRATRSLCSATKLVSAGYSIEMKPTQSVLHHRGGGSLLLRRCGKRDFLSVRVTKFVRSMPSLSPPCSARFSLSRVSCVHCVLVTCLHLR